jgi:preprotein translocase subunit SecF
MSEKRSIWTRLYHGETTFDFMTKRRRWFTISLTIIVLGLLSLGFRQLNLGIDFRGGTSWEVPGGHGLSVSDARDALPSNMRDAKVQSLGSGAIRVQADARGNSASTRRIVNDVSDRLAKAAKISERDISVSDVGPSWGKEITSKAQRALVIFLILITAYIWFRFEFKMAAATMAALVHDILVTVGVYSIFGLEVTPPTVIAVLTILGYSIYDGIVVFDKVDENTKSMAASGKMTYTDMVNTSLNQVLMRTLNTSLTALLPILSLLVIGSFILGATTLQEFAIALLIGLGAGAYSSIFIASPLLAILKEREPRFAAVRERLARGGSAGGPLVPGVAATSGAGVSAPAYLSSTDDDGGERPRLVPAAGPITARARKKGRKR